VFRLYDTKLGAVTEISLARPGQLRMCSGGPVTSQPPDLATLRALLLPDLIRRNAERHGLSVIVCQSTGAEAADEAFRADCTRLNLLPPDFAAPPAEFPALARRVRGEVIDIQTGDIDQPLPQVRHFARAEPVRFDHHEIGTSAGTVVTLADLTDRGLDPLAARLEFLEHRHREQADLTWDTLAAVSEALGGWRELVAAWADEPSRPMCADYSSAIGDALDDDLDTPAVLGTLRDLAADREIPAGSKFETFAAADRVLGLDLVSMVGRVRPA
jgi:cysteinyl-tRNA synthetase